MILPLILLAQAGTSAPSAWKLLSVPPLAGLAVTVADPATSMAAPGLPLISPGLWAPGGVWLTPTASGWTPPPTGISATAQPAGTYTYSQRFTSGPVVLSGRMYADNAALLTIDDAKVAEITATSASPLDQQIAAFRDGVPFTASLSAGTHEIRVQVTNFALGPTGLRIDLSAAVPVIPVQPPPTPSGDLVHAFDAPAFWPNGDAPQAVCFARPPRLVLWLYLTGNRQGKVPWSNEVMDATLDAKGCYPVPIDTTEVSAEVVRQ